MEFRYLTGTGIKVSRLCLGALTFGGQIDEKDAINMTHYAMEQGVNFIDTANFYTDGRSEQIVGKAIRDRRDKVILATKVCMSVSDGPNDSGLSRVHVIRQLELSLKRLQTDYVDIYYMHMPDIHTPLDEILETFSILVRSGKVRYIGVSNFAAWQVCQMLWKSDRNHYVAPAMSQMVYNLITRGIEQEFVPFIQEHKFGLVVYNPLAGGLLTGKHRPDSVLENTRFSLDMGRIYRDRYWHEENFKAVETLSNIARESGISMVELAMRWCATRPYVDSIIIGFSKFEQLKQNLSSLKDGPLPPDVMKACDEVWEQLSGNRFSYNR
jgi:Predicted oxidoreductases (related to aryl-alcohol dehydrogenases)